MEDFSLLEFLRDSYQEVSSVATPIEATLLPGPFQTFTLESVWHNPDLTDLELTKVTRTDVVLSLDPLQVLSSTAHDTNNVVMTAHSNSGMLKANLRESVKADKTIQYIDIWKKTKKVSSYNLSETHQHGKIYHDEFFRSFSWNDAEDTLIYVAEKNRHEHSSILLRRQGGTIKPAPAFIEDWGECYEDHCQSVIAMMDAESGAITLVPITFGIDCSFCQPVWVPGEKQIIFSCLTEGPYKLGIKFCRNRTSQIWKFDVEFHNTKMLSSDMACAWSPRISPDGVTVVYLENESNGPHRTCSKLMKYQEKRNEVVLDLVFKCSVSEFPGIYTDGLPRRCFSKDGRYIFFSSIWRSTQVAICVDLKTNIWNKIPVNTQACKILDVNQNIIVASASSPNIEPHLLVGQILCHENESVAVKWICLEEPRVMTDLVHETRILNPLNKNSYYPDLDFEIILLKSAKSSTFPYLMIHPHGGPHSAFTGEYNKCLAAFAKAGFVVCMVNYRGSLGFGQNSVESLLGNIGVQDVEDVYTALNSLKKEEPFQDSRVFLFGGSHGGFICAHMNAKHGMCIDATVLRNPVIDMVCLNECSDIPDWTVVEAGLDFNYVYPKSSVMEHMWSLSPIRDVEKAIVPTLLLLGTKDRRVPHQQGMKYYRALKTNHVPVNVILYDDDHALSSLTSQSDMFIQTSLWFLEYKKAG